MTISSLKVTDGSWRLNETRFDSLNLLVGISGAGKTKTVEAIHKIRRAGLLGARYAPGLSWEITFNIDAHLYLWKGEISSNHHEQTGINENNSGNSQFIKEVIMKDDTVLIYRDQAEGKFLFNNMLLPMLKWNLSAISLLEDENDLAPLINWLRLINYKEKDDDFRQAIVRDTSYRSINSLQELQSANHFPILSRAMVLQNNFQNIYNDIKNSFTDIFPFIDDVNITKGGPINAPFDILAVSIKEKETKEWIPGCDPALFTIGGLIRGDMSHNML